MFFRLSPLGLALLGAVLVAVQVVQQLVLDIPQRWHLAILVLVAVVGAFGATQASATVLASMLAPPVAFALGLLALALTVVVGAIDVSSTAHAVLGGIIVFLAAIGVKPAVPPEARPTVTRGR